MSTNQHYLAKTAKSKSNIDLLNKYSDEHKSDTDSGRSSAHGDKDLQPQAIKEVATKNVGQLKVTRCTEEKLKILFNSKPINPKIIEKQCEEVKHQLEPFQTGRLQVIRRKDAILKRRNMHRRNTIDVNLYDMQKAAENRNLDDNINGTSSKSTNCIDKIDAFESNGFANKIDCMNFNGTSMPGKLLKLS